VDEHIRFPVTLDMTPYTSHTLSNTPDKRDCTYDLFAIVSHIGVNIHKGHYINYAKFNGEWFMFNDHIVEWVSEETVLRSKAYLPAPDSSFRLFQYLVSFRGFRHRMLTDRYLCFYIKHRLEYEYDETLKEEKSRA